MQPHDFTDDQRAMLGQLVLTYLRTGSSTFEIAHKFCLPEALVANALYEAREAERNVPPARALRPSRVVESRKRVLTPRLPMRTWPKLSDGRPR